LFYHEFNLSNPGSSWTQSTGSETDGSAAVGEKNQKQLFCHESALIDNRSGPNQNKGGDKIMVKENYAFLEGNLGANPEIHYFPDGSPVVRMRVATNKFWRDAEGNDQKRTEWHNVVAFRKIAEMIGSNPGYKTGARVKLEGELRTRPWDYKVPETNKTITMRTTEIVLTNFPRLAIGQPNGNKPPLPELPPEMANQAGDVPAIEPGDEIPF